MDIVCVSESNFAHLVPLASNIILLTLLKIKVRNEITTAASLGDNAIRHHGRLDREIQQLYTGRFTVKRIVEAPLFDLKSSQSWCW